MKNKIFTPEFLKEIDYTYAEGVDENTQCGSALSKRPKGMSIIWWNLQGASCTYLGDKLEPNIHMGLEKDGGTRTVFNGYVFTQDDVRKIISLTL